MTLIKKIINTIEAPINSLRWKNHKKPIEQLKERIQNQKILVLNYLNNQIAYGKEYQHHDQFDNLMYSVFNKMHKELEELSILIDRGNRDDMKDFLTILTGSDYKKRQKDSLTSYENFFKTLSTKYEMRNREIVGTPFKDSILEKLVTNESVFLMKVSKVDLDMIGESVTEEFRQFAQGMNTIYHFDIENDVREYVRLLCDIRADINHRSNSNALAEYFTRNLPSLKEFKPVHKSAKTNIKALVRTADKELDIELLEIKKLLSKSTDDWHEAPEMVGTLYNVARQAQTSGLYTLKMVQGFGNPSIEMVPKPVRKKTTFEELVGYNDEKAILIKNTEQLINGEEANNAFIYGPPGTGKSSMINALLTRYKNKGLRVLEISKEYLPFLPSVFEDIESKEDFKYIIQVDEFQVGDNREFYDVLKKVMEGSFDGIPYNAVLYVISNSENSSRLGYGAKKGQDEDTLAVDDRFGLKVRFHSPNESEQRDIMQDYLNKKNSNKTIDDIWSSYAQYCSTRKITAPNPRNIRDFVKTV